VAGSVGKRARRRNDAVGPRAQARKLVHERPRDPLDAADLAPRRGTRVDYDLRDVVG